MNQFEFLSRVTIGQYLPLDSPIHRLDPRARLLAFTALVMALTFTVHPLGLTIGLAATLLLIALARIPLGYALSGLLPPMPFLVFIAALQILFNAAPDIPPVLLQIGGLAITPGDLAQGGLILLRFSALILAISLSSCTLSTSELTHGLDSLLSPLARFGLPVNDFILMIQVTLRFIPFLAQAAERIAKAQASRGAEWGSRQGNIISRTQQVLPLIVPLFLTSLRRAEAMALAMDARAYGAFRGRTSLIQYRWRIKDTAALLLAAVLFVLIILS